MELKAYGLTEEVLLTVFRQACVGQSVCWKLTSIPAISFYQTLHKYLKKWPLTRTATNSTVAKFYVAIDPFLKAKGCRPDNTYRFIENLTKLQVPPDQPVNYRHELVQKQKIASMKLEIQDCRQKVDNMCTEFEELTEELRSSKTKLERTEKVLRNVTNQRDTAMKSRDFVKKKLSDRYLALQEDCGSVHGEHRLI